MSDTNALMIIEVWFGDGVAWVDRSRIDEMNYEVGQDEDIAVSSDVVDSTKRYWLSLRLNDIKGSHKSTWVGDTLIYYRSNDYTDLTKRTLELYVNNKSLVKSERMGYQK